MDLFKSLFLCSISFAISLCFVPTNSYANEIAIAQCVRVMKEQTAGNTSFAMRALDQNNYCKCIVDNMTKTGSKKEDVSIISQRCMNDNARANFIPLCQKEFAPEIQKATNRALDCVCFFDKTVELSIELIKSGKTSATPADEQAIAMKSLELCSR